MKIMSFVMVKNDLVMIFGKLNKRKTFVEQVITFDHKRLFGIILNCNDIWGSVW